MIHISYTPSEECKNLSETYGMICVQCGKCGRTFDDGDTTEEADNDD